MDAFVDSPKELKVDDPEQEGRVLFSGKEMRFHAEVVGGVVQNDPLRTIVRKLEYHFSDHDFLMRWKSDVKEKYELLVKSGKPEDFRFKHTQGRPWDLPVPVKCYGFPD